MSPKKAIAINVQARTLTPVVIETHEDIYEYTSGAPFCVACILPTGDAIYVNDEGLLRIDEPEFHHAFKVAGARQGFVGNGLVVGPTDDEGDSLDVVIDIPTLTKFVTFANSNLRELGIPEDESDWITVTPINF